MLERKDVSKIKLQLFPLRQRRVLTSLVILQARLRVERLLSDSHVKDEQNLVGGGQPRNKKCVTSNLPLYQSERFPLTKYDKIY